jgi:hypothetical protein
MVRVHCSKGTLDALAGSDAVKSIAAALIAGTVSRRRLRQACSVSRASKLITGIKPLPNPDKDTQLETAEDLLPCLLPDGHEDVQCDSD